VPAAEPIWKRTTWLEHNSSEDLKQPIGFQVAVADLLMLSSQKWARAAKWRLMTRVFVLPPVVESRGRTEETAT
jgi:hypothetical protein